MSFKGHRALITLMGSQEGGLDRLYGKYASEMAKALQGFKLKNASDPWIGNKRIEAKVDRLLKGMSTEYQQFVKRSMTRAASLSNDSVDNMIKQYQEGLKITESQKLAQAYRNTQAMEGYISRRVDGLNLSGRVWKIDKQTKEQMFGYLKEGLADGRSAKKMATDLKQYLKNPDKRFRRVRDPETGKLKLSAPAKAYNPGKGVYRSSYANALRTARNETNLAYRQNDYLRYQNLDFVKGIRVNLSFAHPEYDICDEMVGDYPKGFQFSGWHPNCLCYTTTILEKRRDFINRMNGKAVKGGNIKSIPKKAQDYLNTNAEKIKGWSNKPYFLENFKGTKEGFALKAGIGSTRGTRGTPAAPIPRIIPPTMGRTKAPKVVPKDPIIPPSTVITPGKPRGAFVPAKSVEEAERRALALISDKGSVSFRGASPAIYNAYLDTLEQEHAFSSLKGMTRFDWIEKAPNRRLARANGWYAPVVNRISIAKISTNNKVVKPRILFKDQASRIENMIDITKERLKTEPSDYYKKSLLRAQKKYIKQLNAVKEKIKNGQDGLYWSMSSKEADGIKAMQTTLIHEIGHFRHMSTLRRTKEGFGAYKAKAITEYGSTDIYEYFTEWYTYWRKGGAEKIIPKELLPLFKSLKGLQ